MRSLNRCFGLAAAVLLSAPPLFAQDSLQKIKDLYAAAAYEDTLSALTSVADPKPEIEQYRVFALLALGRVDEAEQAVEAVLAAHPRYRPSTAETSPRIQELFTRVRRRVAPDRVKTLYREGRAALEKKDRDAAIALFDEMLLTADDVDIKDQAAVADLRLLGAGFLDLSRALPARPSAAPSAGNGVADKAAAPAATAPDPLILTPPVVIRQDLPVWHGSGTSRGEFSGTVHVIISPTGAVESAEMIHSVHPAYDTLLLNATKKWLYQPAKRNGIPMRSEKSVTVNLQPQ